MWSAAACRRFGVRELARALGWEGESDPAAPAAAVEMQVHAAGHHEQCPRQRLLLAADRVERRFEMLLGGEVVAAIEERDSLFEPIALRCVHVPQHSGSPRACGARRLTVG